MQDKIQEQNMTGAKYRKVNQCLHGSQLNCLWQRKGNYLEEWISNCYHNMTNDHNLEEILSLFMESMLGYRSGGLNPGCSIWHYIPENVIYKFSSITIIFIFRLLPIRWEGYTTTNGVIKLASESYVRTRLSQYDEITAEGMLNQTNRSA